MARREIKVERTTTDAVLQALARVPREGAIVRLPAGRIALDRPLEVPSATTIAGAGPGRTILDAVPTLTTAFTASGGHHISIRDVTIRWSEPTTHPASDAGAIHLQTVDHPTVLAVEVLGAPATAVWLDRCGHALVERVEVRDAGSTGLLATSCHHLDVDHVVVRGAGRSRTAAGIHLDAVTEARVHVDTRGASASAVLLDATSGPLAEVIVHATASGSQRGLSAIATAPHPLHRVTITGTFADNRREGILLANVDRVVVLDAVVERNLEHGIVLDGRTGSRRCTVTGTVVRDCGVALAELGGSRDNAISSVEPAAPPASGSSPTASGSLRALPRRARRSAIVRARRAERAARRAARHAPQPLRRSLGRIRNQARRTWRTRGGRP